MAQAVPPDPSLALTAKDIEEFTPHRFEPAAGYADLLVADSLSQSSFVRLDIEIDETCTSGEPGTLAHDSRKRGVSFDVYGWREV